MNHSHPRHPSNLTDEDLFDAFRDRMRRATIHGFDRAMADLGVGEAESTMKGKGWEDGDLAVIFPSIDAHARVLWDRHLVKLTESGFVARDKLLADLAPL